MFFETKKGKERRMIVLLCLEIDSLLMRYAYIKAQKNVLIHSTDFVISKLPLYNLNQGKNDLDIRILN